MWCNLDRSVSGRQSTVRRLWYPDAVDRREDRRTRTPSARETPVAAPLETSGEGGARRALQRLKERARGSDGGEYMWWVASAGLDFLHGESPATASAVAFG